MSAAGHWSILYRGPLSSCNYSCSYCPFAKTINTRAELEEDARKLGRFVDWVSGRPETIGILFTPWGEALIHPHYQAAIQRLSHLPNVGRVAIQTNLSCKLEWITGCNLATMAFWATFHPGEVRREVFVKKCRALAASGVRFSVGVVGLKNHFDDIERLRFELPEHVYLWVNASKREPNYYSPEDIARLEAVDPLFDWNLAAHPSEGQICRAGHTVFTVDGDGFVRRCHFVKTVLGNIYESGFESALRERRCPNASCGCHIGYVHLRSLPLYGLFGDGVLERIPRRAAGTEKTPP